MTESGESLESVLWYSWNQSSSSNVVLSTLPLQKSVELTSSSPLLFEDSKAPE